MQCLTTPEPAVSYNMLTGKWQSVRIAYPDDPVFRNVSKGKADLVRIHFFSGRKFRFTWEDTVFSGRYKINGDEIIFKGERKEDVATCIIRMENNFLFLELNDGFKFELQKE
ncbi:MAG: hypothetical protein JW864_15590 [Spirochaetes bacterium]|nr:hypothetical protein [Spirochaetota bacterium]